MEIKSASSTLAIIMFVVCALTIANGMPTEVLHAVATSNVEGEGVHEGSTILVQGEGGVAGVHQSRQYFGGYYPRGDFDGSSANAAAVAQSSSTGFGGGFPGSFGSSISSAQAAAASNGFGK